MYGTHFTLRFIKPATRQSQHRRLDRQVKKKNKKSSYHIISYSSVRTANPSPSKCHLPYTDTGAVNDMMPTIMFHLPSRISQDTLPLEIWKCKTRTAVKAHHAQWIHGTNHCRFQVVFLPWTLLFTGWGRGLLNPVLIPYALFRPCLSYPATFFILFSHCQ